MTVRTDSTGITAAIIEPVGGHGGMDSYTFQLCDGLVKAGVTPVLYTSDETDTRRARLFGVRPIFRGIFGSDPALVRGVRFLVAMARVLIDVRLKRASILHFHFFQIGILQFAFVLLGRLVLRRIVITVHDVEAFVEKRHLRGIDMLTYRLAHQLIVHNQISRFELEDRRGVPGRKIEIIPHGHYIQWYADNPSMQEARTHLGWPNDKFIVLFFGQLKLTKGLDILLDALPAVVVQEPRVITVIAGKEAGTPFSYYEGIIERNRLSRHVIAVIRYISNDEVPFYFKASNVVVLPYRRIYQSGVLLLAMSFGVPVVVSDLPGMLEIVHHGETGFVFKGSDALGLSRLLGALLGGGGEQAEVCKNARMLLEREHGWEWIGCRTTQVYERLLT